MARHFPQKRDLTGIGDYGADRKCLAEQCLRIAVSHGLCQLPDVRIDDGIGVDCLIVRLLGHTQLRQCVRYAHCGKQCGKPSFRRIVPAGKRRLPVHLALHRQMRPPDRPIPHTVLPQARYGAVRAELLHMRTHHTHSAAIRNALPQIQQLEIRRRDCREQQNRGFRIRPVVSAQQSLERLCFSVQRIESRIQCLCVGNGPDQLPPKPDLFRGAKTAQKRSGRHRKIQRQHQIRKTVLRYNGALLRLRFACALVCRLLLLRGYRQRVFPKQ